MDIFLHQLILLLVKKSIFEKLWLKKASVKPLSTSVNNNIEIRIIMRNNKTVIANVTAGFLLCQRSF